MFLISLVKIASGTKYKSKILIAVLPGVDNNYVYPRVTRTDWNRGPLSGNRVHYERRIPNVSFMIVLLLAYQICRHQQLANMPVNAKQADNADPWYITLL